ncbi:calponin homology domain-containing protein DDB_G0272472-like [Impatiens glandulifera]|uniref:calponin homology domain-containing protein DDB_G0272472-like n=1 Tax=Impatiens glandulifera TaxID=253017 RepID=UPI001FB11239|nr:calponin homology domain-containing protein DDB_G0272472-like [Impatiens glandulifera]
MDIISKPRQGKGGNFDNLTKLKLQMLMAIVRSDKIDWGSVLFEQFCEMVVKMNGRVQAYAMQIIRHADRKDPAVPSIDPPSSRQAEFSGSQETHSKSKENPAKEVCIHSENSKSPTKNLDDIIDDVGLRTSEGNNEEKEPSDSVGDKSVPTESNPQLAQDGPTNPPITPEGPSQVNKGKEVLIKCSPLRGESALQTGPEQSEILPEDEVAISVEEEEEMFQSFIRDMNKEAEELATPYHLCVRLRCETKLSDMIHDLNDNEYWEKLLALEEETLKVTGTEVIQAAYAKTPMMEEYAKLQAVNDALKKAEGAEITPMELKMIERFQTVRVDLARNVDLLEAELREECKNLLLHGDQFLSRPIFNSVESSKSAENRKKRHQMHETEQEDNRSRIPSQTDQTLGLDQIKEVVVNTIISSLNEFSIATDAKIATIQADLVETVRVSIHSEIIETVQTSIKTMIDKTVKTATAPLLEMMQAMTAQIEELSKLQADRTQEKIRLDAETTRRIQAEEDAREQLRKETEDKDHELAKQVDEEEKVAQPESTPAQDSHSMKTRNKNKRKQIQSLLHQVEQSDIEESQPAGQFEEPLYEEEEENAARINPQKKKAVELSTASTSSGPIVAQSSRPPRSVGGVFRFNQRNPGISSVFTGWQIDVERREREWKEKEEEERQKEKEKGGSSNP